MNLTARQDYEPSPTSSAKCWHRASASAGRGDRRRAGPRARAHVLLVRSVFFRIRVFLDVHGDQHGRTIRPVRPAVHRRRRLAARAAARLSPPCGQTYYAITDRRILIVRAGRSITVDAIRASEISDYQREDFTDGTSNIRLRHTIVEGRRGRSRTTGFSDGLWGITDARAAAQAIEDLRHGHETETRQS